MENSPTRDTEAEALEEAQRIKQKAPFNEGFVEVDTNNVVGEGLDYEEGERKVGLEDWKKNLKEKYTDEGREDISKLIDFVGQDNMVSFREWGTNLVLGNSVGKLNVTTEQLETLVNEKVLSPVLSENVAETDEEPNSQDRKLTWEETLKILNSTEEPYPLIRDLAFWVSV